MVWQPRVSKGGETIEDYAELLVDLKMYEKEISGRMLTKQYYEARQAAHEMRLVLEDLVALLRGAK
jgi:hypothetical protein